MTTITCISDLHGHLPPNLKGGDILIIAGDICPSQGAFAQSNWVNFKYAKWCREQAKKYKHIVAIWGNHDFVGVEAMYLINMGDFPKSYHHLENTSCTVEGLRIFGTPYCMPFGDWPYMLPEQRLKLIYDGISIDTDIIVSHGPPYGYRDGAARHWRGSEDDTKWPEPEHTGSKELTKAIERINPRLVVCGHIHEAWGKEIMPNGTVVVNPSRMNLGYQPNNEAIEVITSPKIKTPYSGR
jgi:Icc-related predicted phosphoesterase